VLPVPEFVISKNYDGGQTLSMEVDEVIAGKGLIAESGLEADFSSAQWKSLKELQTVWVALAERKAQAFNAAQGKAQGDLLRYIEEQLPAHQVIYTTHSQFMVDPAKFDRVRIVEDKSMDATGELAKGQTGTKVHTDVLEVSSGGLFPWQGALGYEISQTLFVGPNSLIVEGVSDHLYIHPLSALLQRKGREGLNKAWTVTPVGGAEKVSTFVSCWGCHICP
jgi:hypothetical protein